MKTWHIVAGVAVLGAGGFAAWWFLRPRTIPVSVTDLGGSETAHSALQDKIAAATDATRRGLLFQPTARQPDVPIETLAATPHTIDVRTSAAVRGGIDTIYHAPDGGIRNTAVFGS